MKGMLNSETSSSKRKQSFRRSESEESPDMLAKKEPSKEEIILSKIPPAEKMDKTSVL